MMMKLMTGFALGAGLAAGLAATSATAGPAIQAVKGKDVNAVIMPKFLGVSVFNQAHQGAMEAAKELGSTGKLIYEGPTPQNAASGQIQMMTAATTQGQNVVMFSNAAGNQISPAAVAAEKAGTKVVTWDSPIPNGKGESFFVSEVDFSQAGKVMANMAYDLTGGKGEMAVLSAAPDAANQNAWIASLKQELKKPKYAGIKLVDVVYGNDQSELSYNKAIGLIDKYPNLKVIMAPTTVGIAAAAKAMQDQKMCGKVKVSGLGLPSQMVSYTMNGCAPEFALWSFKNLGYLAYYASYMLATGSIKGDIGETFHAGKLGDFTITADPTRPGAKRVLLGPFSIYNKSNVQAAAK